MFGRALGTVVEQALDALPGPAARGVRLVAHRGFASVNPENTTHAVTRTAGADAVEVDVRRASSGEVVVCHDATVDRVTDGTGRVERLSAGELGALSVHDSGAGVPTLAALLDAVPERVAVNVELKERGLGSDVDAAADRVENDVWVSAFDPVALRDSSLPRALLFDRNPRENLAIADELDCTAVHPSVALCLGTRTVRRAHARGFDVNAWTVDAPGVAWALARRGVDGVIADRPTVVRQP
ncbi:glycerophosphodiester phosphodiesterase [Salarchaeum japonicum]|uniref:Glycerophosphodiester phosphodiesterase n=1 Tax=Salarchaeum japonicum TaxID=555573 RepID=A0AAV3T1G7_9EURY|nr:glycerophosphodiester phosphodiesterase family protein [Salarchaeum japonicum]